MWIHFHLAWCGLIGERNFCVFEDKDSLVAKLKMQLVSDLFVWNQAFFPPQDCGSDFLSLYIFIFSVSVFFSILSVYCFIFFLFNEIFTSSLIKKKKKKYGYD